MLANLGRLLVRLGRAREGVEVLQTMGEQTLYSTAAMALGHCIIGDYQVGMINLKHASPLYTVHCTLICIEDVSVR